MSKKIINSSEAPAAVGPYSHAVLANGFLFVSGQVPLLADGNLLEGTIEEETHQVMKNLKTILQEASLDFQDVVKCSIFVIIAKINQVVELFVCSKNQHFPTKTFC